MYGYIKKLNDSTLLAIVSQKDGHRISEYILQPVFSKPFKNIQLYKNGELQLGSVAMSDSVKAAVNFSTSEGETIQLKVGISPVSTENALMNIATEIPGWDFNTVKMTMLTAGIKNLEKSVIKTLMQKRKKFSIQHYIIPLLLLPFLTM